MQVGTYTNTFDKLNRIIIRILNILQFFVNNSTTFVPSHFCLFPISYHIFSYLST